MACALPSLPAPSVPHSRTSLTLLLPPAALPLPCSALCGAEMAMIDAGIPITPGSGVSKAIEYWQQTARVIPTRESLVK